MVDGDKESAAEAPAPPGNEPTQAIVVAEPIASRVAELVVKPPEARNRPRELIDAFLRGRKKSTHDAYKKDLQCFAGFLGLYDDIEAAGRRLLECDPGDANALVLEFRDSMIDQGFKPATIARRISSLRALTKLARMLGQINWHLEVPSIPVASYKNTAGPGEEGCKKMIAHVAERGDMKGIRDVAILRLLFDWGMRRGEVCSLDLEHYDRETQRLWVLGKARRERAWQRMPETTAKALEAWIEVRKADKEAKAKEEAKEEAKGRPLFIALDEYHYGHRLTGAGVYYIVREAGDAVGIRTKPHGLRHAAISTAAIRTNGNIVAVQEFARHEDPKTTMLYVDALRDVGGQVARLVSGDEKEFNFEKMMSVKPQTMEQVEAQEEEAQEEALEETEPEEQEEETQDDRVLASLRRMGMLRR